MNRRHRKIIELVAIGLNCYEIAAATGYTFASIETVKSRLMKRFNCRNAAHLVAYCFRNKILQ